MAKSLGDLASKACLKSAKKEKASGAAVGMAPLKLWRRLRRRHSPRPAATPSLPPPRADEIDVTKKGNSNAALAESAKFVSAFVVTLSLENDQGI